MTFSYLLMLTELEDCRFQPSRRRAGSKAAAQADSGHVAASSELTLL
jgi:hypothetical protein